MYARTHHATFAGRCRQDIEALKLERAQHEAQKQESQRLRKELHDLTVELHELKVCAFTPLAHTPRHYAHLLCVRACVRACVRYLIWTSFRRETKSSST